MKTKFLTGLALLAVLGLRAFGCRPKPNLEPALAILSEDAKAMCAPPIEHELRAGTSHPRDVSDAELLTVLRHIGANEENAHLDDDLNVLEASLRSKDARLANLLRYPLVHALPMPDSANSLENKPNHERSADIPRITRAFRGRLESELAWGPGSDSTKTCADLATLVRDVWRVGDLTAVVATQVPVELIASKCERGLEGSPPDDRKALGDILRSLTDDTFTMTSIMKNEFSESRLAAWGGLAPDSILSCDAARITARRIPPPRDDDETRALLTAFDEGMQKISTTLRDPDHDESIAKYAMKLSEMKRSLAELAKTASRPPRKRRSEIPGISRAKAGSSALNPQTRGGETIRVRADGACYFKTIANAPTNSPIDPWRTIIVDCPSELDDPAFDKCLDGTLARTSPTTCACTPDGGGTFKTACPH